MNSAIWLATSNNADKSAEPSAELGVPTAKNIKVEFINMTHSTLQTVMIAIHTKYGVVLYANDFKLDNSPVMGLKPNYDALRRIAKKGVKALILDSLYSRTDGKCPSERVARHMVEEVLLTPENDG